MLKLPTLIITIINDNHHDNDNRFVMKDIALNCVYAAGWEILSDLAHIIGRDDTAAKCKQEFQRTSSAIQSKMFNKKTQSFQSIYKDSRDGVNKFSIANTVQNLFPILLSDLSSTHLNAIVAQLTNTDQFKAPFSIPTVALNDPQFCPTFDADLMWRGPVWGFTNWFILEGRSAQLSSISSSLSSSSSFIRDHHHHYHHNHHHRDQHLSGLGLHKQLDVQADILTSWIKLIQKSGTDMFICETTTIIHCSLSMMMIVMDMMVMIMMMIMMMMI